MRGRENGWEEKRLGERGGHTRRDVEGGTRGRGKEKRRGFRAFVMMENGGKY